MSRSKFATMLAGMAAAFPALFAAHERHRSEEARKKPWTTTREQARADMERKAHNDAIDALKAAKRAAKAARRLAEARGAKA